MKIRWVMVGAVALGLTACVVEPGEVRVGVAVPGVVVEPVDPYFYSPTYCVGCWYGQWGGRNGYHRGGGRPWEREHFEYDHHGRPEGREYRHEGHR